MNSSFNHFSHLLNVPTYHHKWLDDLKIDLTYDEAQFLKNQIITNCKGSMLAHVLENDMVEFLDYIFRKCILAFSFIR